MYIHFLFATSQYGVLPTPMTQMYRIYGNSQEFEMYRLQDSLQSNPDSIKVERTLLTQAQHVLWLGCACMCYQLFLHFWPVVLALLPSTFAYMSHVALTGP